MWSLTRRPSNSRVLTIKGHTVRPRHSLEAGPTARQELIPGFNQRKLADAVVGQIGAGGIGSEIAHGLVKKGVGSLKIQDPDVVEMSNLARQHYYQEDLYKPKAHRLATNLARESTCGTIFEAINLRFQDARDAGYDLSCDVACCGVDSDFDRAEIARHYQLRAPVVIVGIGREARNGYVFVQEPGKACFGCLFPSALANRGVQPCVPSSIDILKVVAGVALYAVDTLLMGLPREWNYKEMFLDGVVPERSFVKKVRAGCPICGLTKG